ncbi:hypothetical protein B1759_12765 [Rubrivirga sp. SAORIC476]|uniref:hypothetical protein n=1 Tax=Rubrivirga sp. SAORIC476 TaxID=1961794 RepID=UPI000BA927AF|nr:hypothetical protein [Rubrivirga sp. SAORIC476]PAP79217.1 hypothetical protein B1759_12765 [Rubrivirga sp. SAORIC476]
MPRVHTAESSTTPATTTHDRPARIYPIENLLTIQTLMKKLNLTPGDCLSLLAEMLEDLDRQITDHEAEGDGLPFPPM